MQLPVSWAEQSSHSTPIENSSYFQDFQWANQLLAHSTFGQNLIQQALQCQVVEIEKHFGFSLSKAQRHVDTYCRDFLINENRLKIEKAQHFKQNTKRTFRVKVQNSDSLIDSWTDFRTQTTTLSVSKSWTQEERRLFFIQQLAHENAIYFDQKSNLNIRSFSTNSPFSEEFVPPDSLSQFLLASNNPVLTQVFAVIRAFRVEYTWLQNLLSNSPEGLRILKSSYPKRAFPFLFEDCKDQCLLNYLIRVSENWSQFALPLLSFNNYWSQRLAQFGRTVDFEKLKLSTKILVDNRVLYLSHSPRVFSILDSSALEIPEVKSEIAATKDFFQSTLIPIDIEILSASYFESKKLNFTSQTGVEFLSTPSLGSFGISHALGPRPRIRPGSQSLKSDEFVFMMPTINESHVDSSAVQMGFLNSGVFKDPGQRDAFKSKDISRATVLYRKIEENL